MASSAHGGANMTKGGIASALVMFALPLLMTTFFQQLYVTVDSIIVGQYAGKVALGAVSNCSFLISSIVLFFNGVSVGAGVVLAQLFGSHDRTRFGRAVWSSGAVALVAGLLLTAVCAGAARPCLALMNLEGDVLDQAVLYMQVYALGTLPTLVYNMGSSVFRSCGDSVTPMVVLAISSLVNLVVVYLLVAVCGLGVVGAAAGTAVAQLLSAVLTLGRIACRREMCCIEGTRPTVDAALVKKMLGIGVPNGVQMMVICLSSVIISSQINLFGIDVMDGFGAYTKVDGWLYMPVAAIQSAIVTFVGQNVGAGLFARARRGVWTGLAINVATTVVLCGALWMVRYPVLGLFSPDAEVVQKGVEAMAVIVPLYTVYTVYMSVCGLYYGVGSTVAPMVLALSFMCAFRIVWVFAVQAFIDGPAGIYLSYPVTWVFMAISMAVYYRRGAWNYRDEIVGASAERIGRDGDDRFDERGKYVRG